MSKLRVPMTILLALIMMLTSQANAFYRTSGTPPDETPRGLIVKFRDQAPGTEQTARGVMALGTAEAAQINQINERHGVTAMESLLPVTAAVRPEGLQNLMVVLAAPEQLGALKAKYEALNSVEYVELDYPLELFSDEPGDPPPQIIPRDPLYAKQWYLHNTAQLHPAVKRLPDCGDDTLANLSGVADADIDGNEIRNSPPANLWSVTVAVIDCGVDLTHIELSGKAWVNSREVAGNGIDDDNNGYVDDRNGWDWAASPEDWYVQDSDPSDSWGHGTHIAGIIASGIKNNIGISGMVPTAKIMALKVFPRGFVSYLIAALVYAADQNADVVNMSLGTYFPSSALESALAYAKGHGTILCAAMGNSFGSTISYPAYYQECIAVSALNDSDKAAVFTSYGAHVDVAAPGVDILSLRATGTDIYGDPSHTAGCPEPNVHIVNTYYYLMDGTSMASPVAAGVAAYMRAASPGLSPDAAQAILQSTADDILYPRDPGDPGDGWDQYTGYGRVNVWDAVQATTRLKAAITSPKPYQLLSGQVTVTGAAEGTGFTSYTLEFGEGADPSTWTEIVTSSSPVPVGFPLGTWNTAGRAGTYSMRVRVGDNNFDHVIVNLVPQTVAEITEPDGTAPVVSWASVTGSAYCPDFRSWELAYRALADTAWHPIESGTVPAFDGELGTWLVNTLPEGDYVLRLEVRDATGVAARDTVIVAVLADGDGEWRRDLDGVGTLMAAVADIDDDGLNEVLMGTDQGLKVFGSDGSWQDSLPFVAPDGAWMVPISIGNLDADGKPDFVGAYQSTTGPALWGFRSTGGEFEIPLSLSWPIESSPMVQSYYDMPYIMLRDADGNGQDEIYFRSKHNGIIKAVPGSSYPVETWPYAADMIIDDLDGDGTNEVYQWTIAYGYDNVAYSVLLQLSTSGDVMDSTVMGIGDSLTYSLGLAVQDVTGDGQREIVAFGAIVGANCALWLIDADMDPLPGFPRAIPLPSYLVPELPVFGDLDNDPELEYVTTVFEGLTSSVLYAWNLDGTPVSAADSTGLLAAPTMNCQLSMLLLTDITGDGAVDILAGSRPFWPGDPNYQTLWAWTGAGNTVSGFPIILGTCGAGIPRYTPTIGDVDADAIVDLLVPTAESTLVFKEFGHAFDVCSAPVTSWRFHPNFDGIGPSNEDTCEALNFVCGDCNADGFVDSNDVDYLAAYLTGSGPAPVPYAAGDVNESGFVDLTDLSWLVSYIELGYPEPCSGSGMAIASGSTGTIAPTIVPVECIDGVVSLTSSSDIHLVAVSLIGAPNAENTGLLAVGCLVASAMNADTTVMIFNGRNGRPILTKGTNQLNLGTDVQLLEIAAVGYDGNATIYRVESAATTLPTEFSLSQCYPNPFNPSTTISFDLPVRSEYTLTVYNALGQEVSSVTSTSGPGTVAIEWDGAGHASGVYLYRLTAGQFSSTKKMLLMK